MSDQVLDRIEARETAVAYRSAPHNSEAEQQLLGAMLINNDATAKVSEFLRPAHFAEALHGRVYEAIQKLIERGEIANPVTLKAYFERDPALSEVGGAEYLARLASNAVTIIRAEEYGRLIYDLALRRELIQVGEDIVLEAYDADIDERALSQIERAEGALYRLAEDGERDSTFVPFSLALARSADLIDAAHKRDGRMVGVTTGLVDMDKKLGGLHGSDLVILAGRPAMGKTALATTIAVNAARAYRPIRDDSGRVIDADGAVVGFFSLEMSTEQLATRILAERTRIGSERLRRGEVSHQDFTNKIMPAVHELQELPLFIDDTPALSIAQLRSRARRLKRTQNLGLVVVDYLQLMRPSGLTRTDNRVQEVSEITQGLKALAKELSVPVLALSQLSRAVEQREDKRPQLADLRESGSIEQDADVVMFVYREEYYLAPQEPPADTEKFYEWQEKMAKAHNRADVIVGKQRHGPTGIAKLMFEPEFTAFRNLEQIHDDMAL